MGGMTDFFIMAYRSALPMVWPSPSNWNEAAVSVAPGSWAWLVGGWWMRFWVTYDNDLALLQDRVVGNDFLLGLLGIDHGLVGVLGVDGFRHGGLRWEEFKKIGLKA